MLCNTTCGNVPCDGIDDIKIVQHSYAWLDFKNCEEFYITFPRMVSNAAAA